MQHVFFVEGIYVGQKFPNILIDCILNGCLLKYRSFRQKLVHVECLFGRMYAVQIKYSGINLHPFSHNVSCVLVLLGNFNTHNK